MPAPSPFFPTGKDPDRLPCIPGSNSPVHCVQHFSPLLGFLPGRPGFGTRDRGMCAPSLYSYLHACLPSPRVLIPEFSGPNYFRLPIDATRSTPAIDGTRQSMIDWPRLAFALVR